MSHTDLYEEIGGEHLVRQAAESLYARILIDNELAPFFAGMDVTRIQARQEAFLAYALSDKEKKPADDLRAIHARLVKKGLNHHHFDLLIDSLKEVLIELDIAPKYQVRAVKRIEATRKEIIGETYSISTMEKTMFSRIISFIYGTISYAVGMASLAYAALWLGDIILPTTLDSPRNGSVSEAFVFNFLLIVAFGVQHSVMARPAFKERWTKIVSASIERSTYVLVSGIAFTALMYFWQPIGVDIWHLRGIAAGFAYAGYALGWGLLVASTFAVNHFDLFGLRQIWLNLRGMEYTQLPFVISTFYRYCRHPLYVGWLMVIWFTPHMTLSHIFFSAGVTLYILIAIVFEERDLKHFHPEYANYQKRVPMLMPNIRRRSRTSASAIS
jgi:methanethiol S-methyltransferase